jgi:hypothetical protein
MFHENENRMTWLEWLRAAGGVVSTLPPLARCGVKLSDLREAWRAGEDPSDYRAMCAPPATATHDNGKNVRDLGPLSDMFD